MAGPWPSSTALERDPEPLAQPGLTVRRDRHHTTLARALDPAALQQSFGERSTELAREVRPALAPIQARPTQRPPAARWKRQLERATELGASRRELRDAVIDVQVLRAHPRVAQSHAELAGDVVVTEARPLQRAVDARSGRFRLQFRAGQIQHRLEHVRDFRGRDRHVPMPALTLDANQSRRAQLHEVRAHGLRSDAGSARELARRECAPSDELRQNARARRISDERTDFRELECLRTHTSECDHRCGRCARREASTGIELSGLSIARSEHYVRGMTASSSFTSPSARIASPWTPEAIAVTCAASFGFALVQLDVTIINVALPAIADALECGVSGLQWLVDAYALTFAVLLLTCGALTDRLGARRVYLSGLALFAVASVAGIALTLVAWPAFLWVEAKSRAPMLPLRIFRTPSFTAAVLFGVDVNLTYYGIVFVLSLYLQRVQGYSPLRAGFAYLPLTATFFAINVYSGQLIGRIGTRKPMLCGALIDACGFALLCTLAADSSYWQMLPAFALLPAGMGLGVPAMTTTVLASVGREASGIAGGVLNSARQAAGVIGVAVFGSLAGDGSEHVVSALHTAALSCVALLLTAAAVVYFAVPSGRER